MTMSMFSVLSALMVASPALAHMAPWDPSMYGFDHGYEPVTPLSDQGFEQWFMHGYKYDQPQEVKDLPAGGQVKFETACSKEYTSWGSQTTDPSDPMSACPNDVGSYHADFTGDGWDNVLGCGLAMADSNDVDSVQPEDFTVFSVNQQCVTSRDTYFQVPQDMPSCSQDWCLCAWSWSGQKSANEMYHIGFRCKPSGTDSNAKLLTPGNGEAKAPHYWANYGHMNVDTSSISYNNKPSYLDRDGFSDGAQSGISTTSGNSSSGNSSSGGSSSSSGGGGGGGGWGGGGGGGGSSGGGGGGGGWGGGGGGGSSDSDSSSWTSESSDSSGDSWSSASDDSWNSGSSDNSWNSGSSDNSWNSGSNQQWSKSKQRRNCPEGGNAHKRRAWSSRHR